MWEHDFRRTVQMDFRVQDFLAARNWDDLPLDPREAFYGGRTNAIRLYHEVSEGEKIRYLDVCSLYPYVNKYAQYPTGHPTIYLDNFPPLAQMEGVIKCTVVPPTDLFHPVLPYRYQGKLLFPLCRTCAETRYEDSCPHTTQERALTGTWIVDEVRKAVSLGYRITKVCELWQYEMVRYDPTSKTGGLFSGYIDHFVKMKQESSGWPSRCTTEETKAQYIADYQQREGVTLDPASISVNPGRRSLAKLCLNSFWGKLGQRSDMPKCQFFDEPADFFALMSDPNVEVSTLLPINQDIMGVKYRNHQDIDITLPHTNVVLAAYTTTHARLKLYSYLEFLQRRVLYFDTDSVIFTSAPGEVDPPTGDFLGELTDELTCYGPGSYIREFISGGPKNYGYVAVDPSGQEHISMKVKGFRLDHATSARVNMDVLKKMLGVTNEEEDIIDSVLVKNPCAIRRLKDHTVVSRGETKTYRIVYDKRRRTRNYQTLPYGYV